MLCEYGARVSIQDKRTIIPPSMLNKKKTPKKTKKNIKFWINTNYLWIKK